MRGPRLALAVLLTPMVLGLALASTGAALVAHLGRFHPRADLAAQFAPLWLGGAVVALILGLLLPRGLRLAASLISVVGVIAAGWLLAPELLRDTGPAASPEAPGQIKVIQFNMRGTDDLASLEWLVAEDPDIVLAEEFTKLFVRKLTARTGWNVACPSCRVMIFSKQTPVRELAAKIRGKGVVLADDEGPYPVVAVHYPRPTNPRGQRAEEQRVLEMIAEFGAERMILGGDLNSSPWSFSRRLWDSRFEVIRRDKALMSWPAQPVHPLPAAPFPILAIDHIYAGPGWATVSVKRGPRLASDHFPVVAVLAPVR